MRSRVDELTALVLNLADRLERCSWLLGKCSERRGSRMSAFKHQEDGEHYKDMAIQPAEFVHKNGIGFIEGNVIYYVSRWKRKNGLADLKKARHFLDLLIEMEMAKVTDGSPGSGNSCNSETQKL